MYFIQKTLDDILYKVFKELLSLPFETGSVRSAESGALSELIGVTIELENPRARLSRTDTKGKIFSALGELLWYLAKDETLEFIQYYIDGYEHESFDGKSVYGAYGPRLFNSNGQHNQINNIITLLRERPTSKRAVIQLFESRDIAPEVKENEISIPCTCLLQFLLRNDKLNLIVYMRSNDAFKGLPHDVFAFTMIQEVIAKALGVDLGFYKHIVGSLHLYETNKQNAEKYVAEGFQSTKYPMPEMPNGDPFIKINELLSIESQIRHKDKFDFSTPILPTYWNDLAIILAIFGAFQVKDKNKIENLRSNMFSKVYDYFIVNKIESIK